MSAASSTPPSAVRKARESVTSALVKAHFEVEQDLQVVYVMRPNNPDDAQEPIALLEVNAATFPSGSITPFAFAPNGDVSLPVLVAEVTPAELEAAKAGRLPLPNGWSIESAKVVQRGAK